MATLAEARAAKEKARRMWPCATVGIAGRGPDGRTVRVGLRTPLPDALSLPADIDGVPVSFTTAESVKARMAADRFRRFGPARMLEWREMESVAAALEDGERMRRMVEAMADDYETRAHPCCPLCGCCADEPPAHEDGCDFGRFLEERLAEDA